MTIVTQPIETRPGAAWKPKAMAPIGPVAVSRLTGDRADAAAWDDYVAAAPDGSWFHTTAWMRAVHAVFGHEPIYLVAWVAHPRGECAPALRSVFSVGRPIVGVLPLFLIRSLLGGRMLVSVPYGVYGGVLADDGEARTVLHQALLEQVKRLNVSRVDLRSRHAGFEGLGPNDRYVTFRRELPDRPEDVLAWLPRKARAASRHGRDKHGLTIAWGDELLPQVWDLYSRSMRRLASIHYPLAFFQALVEQAPERTLTSAVYYQGRPVGGLLTLLHGDTVMPYFVGLDHRFRFAGVSNFLYYRVMQWAVEHGYRVFDFGRSRRDNEGCCNFKRFHGFEPETLGYQRLVAAGAKRVDLTPTGSKFSLARRVWPHLPLALTRPLGAWLAKHIPG